MTHGFRIIFFDRFPPPTPLSTFSEQDHGSLSQKKGEGGVGGGSSLFLLGLKVHLFLSHF